MRRVGTLAKWAQGLSIFKIFQHGLTHQRMMSRKLESIVEHQLNQSMYNAPLNSRYLLWSRPARTWNKKYLSICSFERPNIKIQNDLHMVRTYSLSGNNKVGEPQLVYYGICPSRPGPSIAIGPLWIFRFAINMADKISDN
jgi:hypothetical protein